MNSGLIAAMYLTLLAASTAYALALNTSLGRKLCQRKTWVTVVIGDAIIGGCLFIALPPATVALVLGAFIVAGLPIIARSIANELKEIDSVMESLRDEAQEARKS